MAVVTELNLDMQQEHKWVDDTWKKGDTSAFSSYWVGWASILIGVYGMKITLFALFTGDVKFGDMFSLIGFPLASSIFIFVGVLSIVKAKNLVNRVREINFFDEYFRVEFWWRGKRKYIEFTLDDVESVELCKKERRLIDRLAKLPREAICYQIKINEQPDFIVTGTDESIHDIVKKLKS